MQKLYDICKTSLLAALLVPFPAEAAAAPQMSQTASPQRSQAATPLAGHLNLNLASTKQCVSAGHLPGFQPVSISVAGKTLSVASATMLTCAEAVAVCQVLRTGLQSVLIGVAGDATGGKVTITPQLAQQMTALTVPAGVTVIARADALNLAGNLFNSGTIYAVPGNRTLSSFALSALNIANYNGALLSTNLLPGSLSGLPGPTSNANLQLNAVNSIFNAGTISSAASLSMNAGTSITNSSHAVLQAVNHINLQSHSGNFVNNGLIAAQTGNVNFSTGENLNNICLTNQLGSIEALNGSINMRESSYGASGAISIEGGRLLSKELNLYSGSGSVDLNTGELSGVLNIVAGQAHVLAGTSMLTLGNNCISGDPLYANTGSIEIDGALTTGGAGLAVIAGHDIVSGKGVNSASINTGGGPLWLIAGADITGATGSSSSPITNGAPSLFLVRMKFDNSSGGNIDLVSSNAPTVLKTGGGAVTVLAHSNGAGTGNIWFPTGSISCDTSNPAGGGGAIFMAGGGNGGNFASGGATAMAIQTGQIQTAGATAIATGNVQIFTANPRVGDGREETDFINSGNSAACMGVFAPGAITPDGQMRIGNILTLGYGGTTAWSDRFHSKSVSYPGGSGGSINLQAGGDILAGNLLSYGGGGAGGSQISNGGTGGDAGAITAMSCNGKLMVNGEINASGGGGGGGSSWIGTSGGAQADITLSGQSIVVTGNIFSFAGSGGGTVSALFTGGGGGGSFGGGGGGAICGANGGGGGAGAASGGGGAAGAYYSMGGTGGGFAGGGTGGISDSSFDFYGGNGAVSADYTYGSNGSKGGDGGYGGGSGGSGSGSGNNLLASGGSYVGGTAGPGNSAGGKLNLNCGGSFTAPTSVVVGKVLNYGLLRSLDLAQPAVQLQIASLIASGAPGLSGSPSALTIDRSVSSITLGCLSALNVPAGSTLTFSNFGDSSPAIGVNITGSSTKPRAIVDGSLWFAGGNNSSGVIYVRSQLSGPALLVSGVLTSDRNLAIDTVSIQNDSFVGAPSFLVINASGGSISGSGLYYGNAVSLASAGGNIAADAGGATALRVASSSGSGLSLFASSTRSGAGGVVNLRDANIESVVLENDGKLNNADVSFALRTNGEIYARNAASTAITSPALVLGAGTNITGDGSLTTALLVNDRGFGLSLFASGQNVILSDTTSEPVVLANTASTALSSTNSFTLNCNGSISASTAGSVALMSPAAVLISGVGNISGDGSPASALIVSNGGAGLSLFASGNNVNLGDPSLETISLSNAGGSLAGRLSFALSATGDILCSAPGNTAIRSDVILLKSTAGNITGNGLSSSPLPISGSGTGLNLYASGNIVNLCDLSGESVILHNTSGNALRGSSSFALLSTGSVFAELPGITALTSPNIRLVSTSGDIKGSLATTVPMNINNAGAGLNLFAAGREVNLADITAEPVSLANGSGNLLSGTASFSLLANGNVTASDPLATAVVCPVLSLVAVSGTISGDGTNARPLFVNNAGGGLLLYASASGTGSGQGGIAISDNSISSETMTLSNLTATPGADQWFSLANGGSILNAASTRISIASPNITLKTSAPGSTIGCNACAAGALRIAGLAPLPATVVAGSDSGVFLLVEGSCRLTINTVNSTPSQGVSVIALPSGVAPGNITLTGNSRMSSTAVDVRFNFSASGGITIDSGASVVADGPLATIYMDARLDLAQVSAGSTLFCQSVELKTANGNIGSSTTAIGVALPAGATASGVTVTANAGGSVYVASPSSLILGSAPSSAGGTFSALTSGDVQIASGKNLSTSLYSPSISLSAGGAIGDASHWLTVAADKTAGSAAQTVSVTAVAGGDVYLLGANSKLLLPVNLVMTGSSSAGGSARFDAAASGSLTVAGTVVAPGGRIDLLSDELTVNASASLETSSAADGGLIRFSTFSPGVDVLSVVNNGVIKANGTSRGTIGFSTNGLQSLKVSGTGSLEARNVNFGDMDNSKLTMIPPFVTVSSFSGKFSLGNISVEQTQITGLMQVSGAYPSVTPARPFTGKTSGARSLWLFEQPGVNTSYLNGVLRVPTDLTPREEPSGISRVTSFLKATQTSQSGDIAGALFVSADFNDTVIAGLNRSGLVVVDSENNVLNLKTGNIVIAPAHDTTVTSELGSVYVARGAVAFVMKTGNSLCVYDLCDGRAGDIFVVSNGHKIEALPGTQILLTRQPQPDFDSVNPGGRISYRGLRRQDLGKGITLFNTEFSIYSALSQVRPLHQLVTSSDPAARRLGSMMLRSAVIIARINGGKPPYSRSRL